MQMSALGRLLVLGAIGVLAAWGGDAPRLAARLDGPSFPEALLALGTLVVLALSAWTVLITALVAAGASSRLVVAVSPRALRRAILVGAAGALVVAPAHAEQAGAPDTGMRHSVSGLPFPDRPDAAPAPREVSPSAPRPAAASAATDPAGGGSSVEVRPGDTLWAIAGRSLPAGANASQVAAATRAWHDANRVVIGDDPDLIFPAQRLVPPTAKDLP
jgi:hypothetical protein